MMELDRDSFDIKCDRCGEIITIYKDDIDFDISSYDHRDNAMGEELIYSAEFEVSCHRCNNKVLISVCGNEYPIGAYDYDESKIYGGSFIDKPSMCMKYYVDEFSVDDEELDNLRIRELIVQIAHDKELLYKVSPREFEEIVEQVLKDNGFETVLTKPTRDGGKDIIATIAGIHGKPIVIYVECKRYSRENRVDVSIVRELYGVQSSERVNKACLITSSLFTKEAIEFAQRQNVMIDLIDVDELHQMIIESLKK